MQTFNECAFIQITMKTNVKINSYIHIDIRKSKITIFINISFYSENKFHIELNIIMLNIEHNINPNDNNISVEGMECEGYLITLLL